MIPIAKPEITDDDAKSVAEVVLSGWILQGPKVKEFETLLATYIGTPYAVATSSCTTAMHLGFLAAGIQTGDEIIVPSMSFIASANSVVHAGGTPVFADIDARTYTMDPVDVERNITKKTKGILAVHQIGLPADMDALSAIAKKHNLMLFEDAACGLGSKIHGRHVGTYGLWSAFSFHPRKALTTAEGGLLATNTKTLADAVSRLRQHGASLSVSARHDAKKVLTEKYPTIGYNARMSDIHAALGISQFKRFDRLLQKRKTLAEKYNNAFTDNPKIIIPYVPPGFTHTYQSYMVRIPGIGHKRTQVMQHLLDTGIATRAGVMAAHLEKPYRKMYPRLKLSVTEKISTETIILPLFPQMTASEQEYVIKNLNAILKNI